MPYQRFGPMDLYALIARWHAGYRIREISRILQIDRKTVRRYLRMAQSLGVSQSTPLPEKDELLKKLLTLIPANDKPRPSQSLFEPYEQEIRMLLGDERDPLKAKTAYEVICSRYGLDTSYSSFKRFMQRCQVLGAKRTTCRFETEPGEEMQIDYGKMGLLYSPLTQKNRVVHAFVAALSMSRVKYIEFVDRLDQRSFIASHVRMFEVFGGVPKRVVIDNLKTGVVKPSLYDPKLNRAYQELADHYGFFIDPARVRHPKDKGKVERTVPIVREFFRKLKALHPNLDLTTANKQAQDWAFLDNGMKPHGTTGRKPYEVFIELEKPALQALPEMPFEIATWKEAKVHVDQFIQFEKTLLSVPTAYVGKTVWVRGTEKMIEIYDGYERIKQHARKPQGRLMDPRDFPENFQLMLNTQAIQYLIARAAGVGPNFEQLLRHVLTPHAMLNYRRARALLNKSQKYPAELVECAAQQALAQKIYVPNLFQRLLNRLQSPTSDIPVSEQTLEFIRSADYFIH